MIGLFLDIRHVTSVSFNRVGGLSTVPPTARSHNCAPRIMAELCPPLQARGASVAAVPAPLQPARRPSFILDQVAESNGCGPHKFGPALLKASRSAARVVRLPRGRFAPPPRGILCSPCQSDPRRIASRILPRAFLCVTEFLRTTGAVGQSNCAFCQQRSG